MQSRDLGVLFHGVCITVLLNESRWEKQMARRFVPGSEFGMVRTDFPILCSENNCVELEVFPGLSRVAWLGRDSRKFNLKKTIPYPCNYCRHLNAVHGSAVKTFS